MSFNTLRQSINILRFTSLYVTIWVLYVNYLTFNQYKNNVIKKRIKYLVISFDVSRNDNNAYLCKKMNINKIIKYWLLKGYINFL